MLKTKKTYENYYRSNSRNTWPMSENEFWAKMSEDMDFYVKWAYPNELITFPKPKNKVKEFITNLIKL